MTTPVCSIHKSQMKEGKAGGYFCPRKMEDGSWCTQRVAAPKATEKATNGAASTTTPQQLLVIAALDFASRVFQGSGQGDDALDLANRALAGFREES